MKIRIGNKFTLISITSSILLLLGSSFAFGEVKTREEALTVLMESQKELANKIQHDSELKKEPKLLEAYEVYQSKGKDVLSSCEAEVANKDVLAVDESKKKLGDCVTRTNSFMKELGFFQNSKFKSPSWLHADGMPKEVIAQCISELDELKAFGRVKLTCKEYRELAEHSVVNSDVFLKATGIKTATLPGGTFQMGSAKGGGGNNDSPQHEVTVSPFEVMDTHLTRYQARKLGFVPELKSCYGLGENEKTIQQYYAPENDNKPMTCISWEDVDQKIIPLFAKQGIKMKMMTEKEAEYIERLEKNREITQEDYPVTGEEALKRISWSNLNSAGRVHDVRTTEDTASPGLYDTHGNVYSWVKDWYGPYSEDSGKYPEGPESGSLRVIRGGSFRDSPGSLRSASRSNCPPGSRGVYASVRLVRIK
jgi:formylglycine-generating enzyme required for sulfatase activity